MNRKELSILAAVVIIGLVVLLAVNYSGKLKSKSNTINENKTEEIEQVEEDSSKENKEIEKNEEKDASKDAETNEEEKETDEDENEIAIGKLAPDFTLKNLEGKVVSLSDYRGKIVLINFWATWCKFCDVEMPDLDAVDKENDDVVVLAVDVNETETKVKKYIEKGGYEFEVVLDSDGAISRQYLVSAFPTTYVVDKEGILEGGVPGMMTKPQMEQIIENVREKQ